MSASLRQHEPVQFFILFWTSVDIFQEVESKRERNPLGFAFRVRIMIQRFGGKELIIHGF